MGDETPIGPRTNGARTLPRSPARLAADASVESPRNVGYAVPSRWKGAYRGTGEKHASRVPARELHMLFNYESLSGFFLLSCMNFLFSLFLPFLERYERRSPTICDVKSGYSVF
jgi:hypothetical protein